MSDLKLPPRPNPDTGLPKPPAGPLDNSWGISHRRPTDRTTPPPKPSPGQGPALEWIPRSWRSFRYYCLFYMILLGGFLTLKDWGFEWTAHWTLWLMVVIISGLAALATWSSDDMGAGADWFSYGKTWLKTYEITEMKLSKSWGADNLEFKDADGNKVSISILKIQNNPDLWNLVYNGILHSVHYGGATVNQRARERLQLDLDARLPSGDDPGLAAGS